MASRLLREGVGVGVGGASWCRSSAGLVRESGPCVLRSGGPGEGPARRRRYRNNPKRRAAQKPRLRLKAAISHTQSKIKAPLNHPIRPFFRLVVFSVRLNSFRFLKGVGLLVQLR